MKDAVKILAIGDSYMPSAAMKEALIDIGPDVTLRLVDVGPDDRPPLDGVYEYQGDPARIAERIEGESVLVVHAAPITRDLLEAHPSVRMVACLRGGPVNIDLAAARTMGVQVTNTPGKNAESVADLTQVFVHMLLRGVGPATTWLRQQADAGVRTLDSTFVGGDWVAREPRGLTLGLIGLGAIGRLVAERARRDGMSVIAFDPYVRECPGGVELVSLADLARRSHVVSVHAKATPETTHIVDAEFLAGLRAEAVLINTARQQLLDESALLEALQEGRLAGAALDVCEPEGRWPELSRLPQVICSPHLGGATVQTQERGLALAVADIRAFLSGKTPSHRVA